MSDPFRPASAAASDAASPDDLSALAWVHDELRRSLEAAHKSLRRFARETEAQTGADLDAVDPGVLRTARAQIHQGAGALELVGLPAPAMVLRASEAAVQRFIGRPHKLTGAVVDDIERASFAVLDYLGRLLAGKNVPALALFPQYRAVQEAAGAERVHPADLWPVDWRWRDLPSDPRATPLQPNAAARGAFESQLLPLIRGAEPLDEAANMSNLCAGLGAGAEALPVATMWKLASAVFEAQARGLLGFDVFSKRVASRLLAQFRSLERGDDQVSERLAQDLLFFCAQSASPGDGRKAPRLAAARQAYGLVHHTPTDYAAPSLGRFDPALIVQARKRVAAAKEAWSAVAGDEMHRLGGLSEQFALVADSLKRLFPFGEEFGSELQHAVVQTQQSGAVPPPALAMEVATSLLYVEAVLEDGDFDDLGQAERVQRLAERLAGVRRGRAPEPLEGWIEELYRRVSERQTMGSVVQELRASLSEAEKLIDQFFRKPEDRAVLIPVPQQLASMRGVLSVLGMDHAAAALLRMRDEVDGLVSTAVDPEHVAEAGVFDRLAGNLGALGFLIDMLGVQPQMAKSLFAYDAGAGTLAPVMGRGQPQPAGEAPEPEASPAAPDQRLIEQAQMLAFTAVRQDVPVEDVTRDMDTLSHDARAADQAGLAATVEKARDAFERSSSPAALAAARGELSEALVDFVATASGPAGLEPEGASPPEAPEAQAAPRVTSPIRLDFGSPDLAQDDEMREIFLEEAREVLEGAVQARAELAGQPDDLAQLTTLRRGFHTLKGSARMVGLGEFGEAAWAGEQLFNTHLAGQRPATPRLLEFTAWSLAYLGEWVEDIAAGRPTDHHAAAVRAAAEAAGRAAEDAASGAPAEATGAAGGSAANAGAADTAPASSTENLAPAPAAAEAALPWHLPPDLPSAADLDLGTPWPQEAPASVVATAAADTLAFEFDLVLDTPFDTASKADVAAGAPADPGYELIDLDLDLDFGVDLSATPPLPGPAPTTPAEVSGEPVAPADFELDFTAPAAGVDEPARLEDDNFKRVGPLRIGIPLFNIYLNEADELSRRLAMDLAEWAMELDLAVGESTVALAHSLAGSSATVGFGDLSQLARALEHAMARSLAIGHGTIDEASLFIDAAEEIRRLLHQFAAGFLQQPVAGLLDRLADHERSSALRLEAATAAAEWPLETARSDEAEPVVEMISLAPPLAEAAPWPEVRQGPEPRARARA